MLSTYSLQRHLSLEMYAKYMWPLFCIAEPRWEHLGHLPSLCPSAPHSSPLFSLPLLHFKEHAPLPKALCACHSFCPECSFPRYSERPCFVMSLGLCSSPQMSHPAWTWSSPYTAFCSIEFIAPTFHIFTFCFILLPGLEFKFLEGMGFCLICFQSLALCLACSRFFTL